MSKRLPPNDPSRPPVRLRLPQISLQELKTIRVAIRRKDVPQDLVATGPLIRSLDDPEDLVLHKPVYFLKKNMKIEGKKEVPLQ
uniref:Transformer n=1 Tax=Trypoxylus dichotomus TaxID=273928 RepID=A0A499UI39_TRYDI|nr:transformer [Trypoxylus dichotomus]